jgi:hypothetical protein
MECRAGLYFVPQPSQWERELQADRRGENRKKKENLRGREGEQGSRQRAEEGEAPTKTKPFLPISSINNRGKLQFEGLEEIKHERRKGNG